MNLPIQSREYGVAPEIKEVNGTNIKNNIKIFYEQVNDLIKESKYYKEKSEVLESENNNLKHELEKIKAENHCLLQVIGQKRVTCSNENINEKLNDIFRKSLNTFALNVETKEIHVQENESFSSNSHQNVNSSSQNINRNREKAYSVFSNSYNTSTATPATASGGITGSTDNVQEEHIVPRSAPPGIYESMYEDIIFQNKTVPPTFNIEDDEEIYENEDTERRQRLDSLPATTPPPPPGLKDTVLNKVPEKRVELEGGNGVSKIMKRDEERETPVKMSNEYSLRREEETPVRMTPMNHNNMNNQLVLSKYREKMLYLSEKHNVDTRTVEWFLLPEHHIYWDALSKKLEEVDRRSHSLDTKVKNPSAWLTKFFNTIRKNNNMMQSPHIQQQMSMQISRRTGTNNF